MSEKRVLVYKESEQTKTINRIPDYLEHPWT